MATYVVFDGKSGDIVHTHTEVSMSGDAFPVSKEEVISFYAGGPGEEVDTGNLDVLEVDSELLRRGPSSAESLYVDVDKRTIAVRPSVNPGRTRRA
jgi:hypothetical protein